MVAILVLAGVTALAAIVAALVRAIATDGYGTRPPPRSHPEEVGSWIDQELSR